MKSTPEALLIIFTRNPELGKVKSRLAKDVGDKAALEIYKFLLKHTVEVTKDLPVEKEVYYSSFIPKNDLWNEKIFTKKLQQGNDLGEKMANAFENGFKNGFKKIVIIGSDLYDLNSSNLLAAFKEMDSSDFVLGPAEDGGYYLLGMTKQELKVFRNKNWSTSTVLEDTLQDLKGEKIALLEMRNDIDYLEDIRDNNDFQQFLQHIGK